MVSHKKGPKAETLLFSLDTAPLRAEKSLFDLGLWVRSYPALSDYVRHSAPEELADALRQETHPETVLPHEWQSFKNRLAEYSNTFGHTSFEFDFMNPTPAETPELVLETVKMYVEGKGSDPYRRQREANEIRDQAMSDIQKRFKLIPNRWFNRIFHWALEAGPVREDSLSDMGMGHTTVRRMLDELGHRFVREGALVSASDIYWLTEDEANILANLLIQSQELPDYSLRTDERKAEWREQMKLDPPAILPTTSRWSALAPVRNSGEEKDILKGVGASAGKVTAKACVLFAPDDFNRMEPGDVLVAVTTTPAWTPLFAMASAVVTDIGGPLSHSSIVAREYGIPAVLATGAATRRIQDGQMITVDGGAGIVSLN
jgi:rifampicin phosphotransferase